MFLMRDPQFGWTGHSWNFGRVMLVGIRSNDFRGHWLITWYSPVVDSIQKSVANDPDVVSAVRGDLPPISSRHS